MKKHTTFQAGGITDLIVCPKNIEDIRTTYYWAQETDTPIFIMGWGSNLLFSDEGFPGIVLQLKSLKNKINYHDNKVIAEAGIFMQTFLQETITKNLGGLDFMYGIPGTIGGCACMNAGTCGHGFGEFIQSVIFFDPISLEEKKLQAKDISFEYRSSTFLKNKLLLLSIEMNLFPSSQKEEMEKIKEAKEKRSKTQPLSYPNAGCIWKNPEGCKAGQLIEEAGLKGFQIGGAQISELHANFIINKEKARSADIFKLMLFVEETILIKYGILLEREIQLVGKFI